MDKQKKIEELFETFINSNNLSLNLDGVVEEKEKNILFVLKESNNGANPQNGLHEFWFQNVFYAKKQNPPTFYYTDNKRLQSRYFNCITKIRDSINKDYGIYYFNINKEGGGSSCDGKKIEEWLAQDSGKRKFLLEELKILSPDIAVVFSSNVPYIQDVYQLLKDAGIKENCIKKIPFHPCRSSYRELYQIFN